MTQDLTEIASATCPSPTYGLLSLRTCLSLFQLILQRNYLCISCCLRSWKWAKIVTFRDKTVPNRNLSKKDYSEREINAKIVAARLLCIKELQISIIM